MRRWRMGRGRRVLIAGLVLVTALVPTAGPQAGTARRDVVLTVAARPWLAVNQPVDQRIEQLLAAMTLDEQARLTYGVAAPASSGAAGYVPGVERLGIPALVLSDGPMGLRDSARS